MTCQHQWFSVKRHGSTNRVIKVFNLFHQPDHGFTLAVPDEWLLGDAEAVLGTDAAVAFGHPLVDKRFKLLLDSLVEPPGGDVQV